MFSTSRLLRKIIVEKDPPGTVRQRSGGGGGGGGQPADLAALAKAKAEHIGLRKEGITFSGEQSAMFRNTT